MEQSPFYEGEEGAEMAADPLVQVDAEVSVEELGQLRIDALEDAMLASGAVVDTPIAHYFVPGMYAREMFIPAGVLVTSKVHKTRHIYVVLKGELAVYDGDGIKLVTAGAMGVTEPGTRRVGLAFQDTVWVTFHANPDDESDLEVIEERLSEERVREDGRNVYREWRAQLQSASRPIESAREIEP